MPFSHIYTTSRGEFRLCCMATKHHQSHNIHEHTIEEYFYSDEMNELRQEFVTGKLDKVKKICAKCITDEENNVTSDRLLYNDLYPKHFDWEGLKESVDNFIDTGVFFPTTRQFTIKLTIFGNFCNLSCYTCLPHNSSKRERELININWIDEFSPTPTKRHNLDSIFEQIERLLPHTAAFVITGGEPLIMKSHYNLLDRVVNSGHAKDITLSYTTNLTMFSDDKRNFLDYIDEFRNVMVNVSIDGIGERNDWIRYGSDWDTLMKNMKTIDGLVDIQVYYTTSILSIFQAKEADELYPNVLYDITVVTNPEFLSVRHLPQDIKDSLIPTFDKPKFSKIVAELNKPRDEALWQKALKYIDDLDAKRPTKAKDLFTELSHVLR